MDSLTASHHCLGRLACRSIRLATLGAIALLAAALTGCSTPSKDFESPEVAVDSLVSALRGGDVKSLEEILGSESDELLNSGDEVADVTTRKEFVRLYDEKHALTGDDEVKTLEIGQDSWPLPIPLVQGDKGWFFDTEAGLDEVLSRRIGRNELDAMQVCMAIVDAQREYASADYTGNGWREYAQKFGSTPGTRDGLYWKSNEGEPLSPLGELAAEAAAAGYTARKDEVGPRPYHGYYYRILTSQGPAAPGGEINYVVQGHMIGGFGIVAWPADYGNSGLKTFIVSHHGVLYEKDLGNGTDRAAREMAAFNPGDGWVKCDVPTIAN